jgi:hypothetical protein
MKPPSPAITTSALADAAGRKTRRVQQKLQEAESQMHEANAVLASAAPARNTTQVHRAVRANEEAERKVHEATRELEVVKEMLEHAEDASSAAAPPARPSGNTGHGVRSLLDHLRSGSR